MLPRSEANSVAANYLLFSLYDSLGDELDDESSALLIDHDLRVYFESSGQNLEMICPLGSLPTDTASIQQVLHMNDINPYVLIAGENGQLLLILQMSEKCSEKELVEALQGLIQTASVVRRELGHS